MSKINTKNSKRKLKEGTASHQETINNLVEQMKKFILKHSDKNPNSIINDISIALFISFSEAFAEDNDPSTNGLNMLDKIIAKVKILMKSYDDLVPEEGQEFDLTSDEEQDMMTTLETDDEESEDSEEDEEMEDEESEEDTEEEDTEEEEDSEEDTDENEEDTDEEEDEESEDEDEDE